MPKNMTSEEIAAHQTAQIAAITEQVEWIECWQCNGRGKIAGCFEDTCCCTGDADDPEDCCAPSKCDICKGNGFYPPAAEPAQP